MDAAASPRSRRRGGLDDLPGASGLAVRQLLGRRPAAARPLKVVRHVEPSRVPPVVAARSARRCLAGRAFPSRERLVGRSLAYRWQVRVQHCTWGPAALAAEGTEVPLRASVGVGPHLVVNRPTSTIRYTRAAGQEQCAEVGGSGVRQRGITEAGPLQYLSTPTPLLCGRSSRRRYFLTLTGREVVVFPAASRATATSVYSPAASLFVFQVTK
jgi:hypothetical protein